MPKARYRSSFKPGFMEEERRAALAAAPATAPATAPAGGAAVAKRPNPVPNSGAAPYEPTPAERLMVRVCRASGMTEEQIAPLVNWPHGLAVSTLKAHFAADIEHGTERLTALIAANLARRAIDPNGGRDGLTAAIFWLKARAGWRDGNGLQIGLQSNVNAPGAAGGPPQSFTLVIGERPEAA